MLPVRLHPALGGLREIFQDVLASDGGALNVCTPKPNLTP